MEQLSSREKHTWKEEISELIDLHTAPDEIKNNTKRIIENADSPHGAIKELVRYLDSVNKQILEYDNKRKSAQNLGQSTDNLLDEPLSEEHVELWDLFVQLRNELNGYDLRQIKGEL